MQPTNLLAQPCIVLTEGGAVYTFPSSGIVARIVEDLGPGSVTTWATNAEGTEHTPPIRVRQPWTGREDRSSFEGLPTEAGVYIVPAQLCAELARRGVGYPTIPAGVQFVTPEMLIFPGQFGHPGGDVRGPVSPGFILRYSQGAWL